MTMSAKTLAALKASIRHWEENVAAETPDDVSVSASDCALCVLFFDFYNCAGCPVSAATGKHGCRDSPYETRVSEAFANWNYGMTPRDEWRAAAQAELDFLRSLLPEDER